MRSLAIETIFPLEHLLILEKGPEKLRSWVLTCYYFNDFWVCLHEGNWAVVLFIYLFLDVFGFGIKVISGIIKWVGYCSLFLCFLEEAVQNLVFHLQMFGRLQQWNYLSWHLFFRRLLTLNSIFFHRYKMIIQVMYFFLGKFC